MPSRTEPEPTALPPDETTVAAAAPWQERADILLRQAFECCRQHERFAKLVERGAPEDEQRTVCRQMMLCDDSLRAATEAYQRAAARTRPEREHEEWWHRANQLWHASREFQRRHTSCEMILRRQRLEHTADVFATLALDYELEASALLMLQQAAEAYCAVRPGARC